MNMQATEEINNLSVLYMYAHGHIRKCIYTYTHKDVCILKFPEFFFFFLSADAWFKILYKCCLA